MRTYFFGNMYLSSIQQGIQAAHVTHDLFIKYQIESPQKQSLFDWATNYKTVILLNAGYAKEILSLQEFFRSEQNPYAWTSFCEEGDSLNHAATSIGIVLPAKFYDRENWSFVDKDLGLTVAEPQRVTLPTPAMVSVFPLNMFYTDPATQRKHTFTDYEVLLAQRIMQYKFAI